MVLFIVLYKVVLTFESVDEILKCDHSTESCWAVLSCSAVYYAVQGGSKFWVCGWNPKVWPFKWKLLSSTFLWCCLLCCTRWFYLLSLWIKSYSVTIQMKATEHYFPVVLFIMLYKVVLSFESVATQKKKWWADLSWSVVYIILWFPSSLRMKFPVVLSIMVYYWAIVSCSIINK